MGDLIKSAREIEIEHRSGEWAAFRDKLLEVFKRTKTEDGGDKITLYPADSECDGAYIEVAFNRDRRSFAESYAVTLWGRLVAPEGRVNFNRRSMLNAETIPEVAAHIETTLMEIQIVKSNEI